MTHPSAASLDHRPLGHGLIFLSQLIAHPDISSRSVVDEIAELVELSAKPGKAFPQLFELRCRIEDQGLVKVPEGV